MTDNAILDELLNILEEKKEIEWGNVVETLNFKGNWMKVRGVLQFLINEKTIVRTTDLNTEVYIRP